MNQISPDPEAPIRVLLIDDDRDDYFLTKDVLEEIPGRRYVLDWISGFDEALEEMCRCRHDVVLVDYRLGVRTGLELLLAARERVCSAPVILLTGQGEFEIDQAATSAGAADFLEKGSLNAVLLERSIRYAIRQFAQEAELERKVRDRTAELALANDSLRDADTRKNNFLATLAHELRNPLAPIVNAVEILSLAVNNPVQLDKSRRMIERQVFQLVRLIDDLLDVSRIARDKLRLELESVNFADTVAEAVEIAMPVFARGGVHFHYAPDPKLSGLSIRGDRVRLIQILTNLFNNAAKYTHAGGHVYLEYERVDDWLRVHIRDTGVGIPPEQIAGVFELFAQIDETLNRSQGGLGIGLALVKRLVEMHGGTVTVSSDGQGRGADFTLTLPLGVTKN